MTFNPFGKDVQYSLSDLQVEMNRMFQRLWHAGKRVNPFSDQGWIPDVDIWDEPERVVVTAELPGIDIEAVDLSFNEGELTISGTKAEPKLDESRSRLISECRYGSFCRSIPISVKIDADHIAAACKAGVLEVILPKLNVKVAKTIKINAGK